MTGFSGIPADAVAFYAELEADNSREWFAANKERYERSVREPVVALTDALADEFGEVKVFRPYVDVRFRADKTPIKSEQGAVVQDAEGMGYYLQVSADGLMCGGGAVHQAPDQLARMRAAVDDDRTGSELAEIVDRLRRKGFEIGGDKLATRPRGFPENHPRIELLRHKSVIAWRQHGTPEWLGTPAALRKVRDDWRAIRPLAEWFSTHVGPSEVPASQRRPGGR